MYCNVPSEEEQVKQDDMCRQFYKPRNSDNYVNNEEDENEDCEDDIDEDFDEYESGSESSYESSSSEINSYRMNTDVRKFPENILGKGGVKKKQKTLEFSKPPQTHPPTPLLWKKKIKILCL